MQRCSLALCGKEKNDLPDGFFPPSPPFTTHRRTFRPVPLFYRSRVPFAFADLGPLFFRA